jgi:glycosyltransferase involved in cell wall biosynthesis
MRILMLTQFYPPLLGGIEQHVRTLSIELKSRGHDLVVVTLQHTGQPAFEIDQGVRVYRIRSTMQLMPGLFSDNKRQYAPPFPDPESLLELRQIILKERPQIVHAHNWLVRSFLPLKAWSKARLVVTLHNYHLTCARVDLTYRGTACSGPGISKCLGCSTIHYGYLQGPPTVISNWIMGLAEQHSVDMFLAVSQAVAVGNNLVRNNLPFRVIPNFIGEDTGTAVGDYSSYLAQLPEQNYLLFVGALARVKGVEVLLQAYSKLKKAPPLVLIGYQSPDWQQIAPANPQNIFVFKNWPHDAVMQAWKRSILALIPSIWQEPCPTVAMEAMLMGKPVIATRMGGLSDIVVDGETGLLVPAGDPLALRDAIQSLLDDPEQQKLMGNMAMQRIAAFQAKSVVPRIEQVYCDLLETPLFSPV